MNEEKISWQIVADNGKTCSTNDWLEIYGTRKAARAALEKWKEGYSPYYTFKIIKVRITPA